MAHRYNFQFGVKTKLELKKKKHGNRSHTNDGAAFDESSCVLRQRGRRKKNIEMYAMFITVAVGRLEI